MTMKFVIAIVLQTSEWGDYPVRCYRTQGTVCCSISDLADAIMVEPKSVRELFDPEEIFLVRDGAENVDSVPVSLITRCGGMILKEDRKKIRDFIRRAGFHAAYLAHSPSVRSDEKQRNADGMTMDELFGESPIMNDWRFSAIEKMIMIEIEIETETRGAFRGNPDEIAREFRISGTAVRRIIRRLQEAGYLSCSTTMPLKPGGPPVVSIRAKIPDQETGNLF